MSSTKSRLRPSSSLTFVAFRECSSLGLGRSASELYTDELKDGKQKRVFNAHGVFSFSSLLLVSDVLLGPRETDGGCFIRRSAPHLLQLRSAQCS